MLTERVSGTPGGNKRAEEDFGVHVPGSVPWAYFTRTVDHQWQCISNHPKTGSPVSRVIQIDNTILHLTYLQWTAVDEAVDYMGTPLQNIQNLPW